MPEKVAMRRRRTYFKNICGMTEFMLLAVAKVPIFFHKYVFMEGHRICSIPSLTDFVYLDLM